MLLKNYQETLDILRKYQAYRPTIGFFKRKYVLALFANTYKIKEDLKEDGFRFGIIDFPEGSIDSLFCEGTPIWYIEIDEIPLIKSIGVDSKYKSCIANHTQFEIISSDGEIITFHHDIASKYSMSFLVRIGNCFEIMVAFCDEFEPIIEKYRKSSSKCYLEFFENPYYFQSNI